MSVDRAGNGAGAGRETPFVRSVGILTVWVIYKHPSDFPESWVLRGQDVSAAGGIKPHAAHHVASTLEGARSWLPPGLVNMGRQPEDDPAIYECWV